MCLKKKAVESWETACTRPHRGCGCIHTSPDVWQARRCAVLAGAPHLRPVEHTTHDRPHTRESDTQREGTLHFFVIGQCAMARHGIHTSTFGVAQHSMRLGPIASEFRVGRPVSLAIGSRRASGLRHHPRGKMHSAFARATAASLANSFADRLPSVAPRQGVMRPASRRTASLIAKRGWINAMDQGDGSPHSLTLSWSLCGVCKLRCCFHIDARVA